MIWDLPKRLDNNADTSLLILKISFCIILEFNLEDILLALVVNSAIEHVSVAADDKLSQPDGPSCVCAVADESQSLSWFELVVGEHGL